MASEQNTINNQSNDGIVRKGKVYGTDTGLQGGGKMRGRQVGSKDKSPRSRKGEMSQRFLKGRQPGGHAINVHMNQGMPPMPNAQPSVGGTAQPDADMTNSQGGGVY